MFEKFDIRMEWLDIIRTNYPRWGQPFLYDCLYGDIRNLPAWAGYGIWSETEYAPSRKDEIDKVLRYQLE